MDKRELLQNLINTWENEVIEFKEARNAYDTDKIGKYFSALSNEANLRGLDKAWLVFGVNDKTRAIVGTNYRLESERLNGLKKQIADNTEPSTTFRNINVLNDDKKRIIMFEIPTAPNGMPIAWKGHYYARIGESLTNLRLDKLDEIRKQTVASDWSAQVVPEATLTDLDETVLQIARDSFTRKHANRFSAKEILGWPLSNFLDRAKVTQDGKITRTALLLLGKPDDYILGDKTPRRYRNSFLVEAMVSLNMIDKMGYGIHDIHKEQAKRYFPMPDYNLSSPDAVIMVVYGSIVDPAYSRLLMKKTNLPLSDILALDRVQKHLSLPDEIITKLRREKLIEGRKPNIHVSALIAEATESKADYIRTRAQDDAYYKKLIIDYLKKFKKASRKEIDKLLFKKLSDALNNKQKHEKISNLLTNMRRSRKIYNASSRTSPEWRLVEKI